MNHHAIRLATDPLFLMLLPKTKTSVDSFRVLRHPLWLSPNTAGMRTGAGAIARAREIVIARNASGAPVTPREIAYIESIAPYFIPANPNEPIDSRALKVGKNLQELFARFGNEVWEFECSLSEFLTPTHH